MWVVKEDQVGDWARVTQDEQRALQQAWKEIKLDSRENLVYVRDTSSLYTLINFDFWASV